MDSIICIEERFICEMKKDDKGKNENGRWQWKIIMTMGNKHVSKLLAFICGLGRKCVNKGKWTTNSCWEKWLWLALNYLVGFIIQRGGKVMVLVDMDMNLFLCFSWNRSFEDKLCAQLVFFHDHLIIPNLPKNFT